MTLKTWIEFQHEVCEYYSVKLKDCKWKNITAQNHAGDIDYLYECRLSASYANEFVVRYNLEKQYVVHFNSKIGRGNEIWKADASTL